MTTPTTPVTDDANASAAELLARARQEHAHAQAGRDLTSSEDRVHGQQHGGGH